MSEVPLYPDVDTRGSWHTSVIFEAIRNLGPPNHTVAHDPFIKSQLASRNQLEGLMWYTFGHVHRRFQGGRNLRRPPRGW
jgi:hypothetical protein